jgi:hypothetical protein
MRNARFQHLLETRGPDLCRWPPELASAARILVAADAAVANELEKTRRLEVLLTYHLNSKIYGATSAQPDSGQLARRMTALQGPLPLQRRRWLTKWPAELLESDFTPAWPRVAVLAGVASLGFMVGLTDLNLLGLPGLFPIAPESDFSMIVFEPEPL